MSVRSEHGFLFGLPQQGHFFVDDMAVEDGAYWLDEGTALLRHAGNADHCGSCALFLSGHALPRPVPSA